MPESKSRHPHHSHQQNHPAPNQKRPQKSSRAVIVAIIFFALLGLGISYFIAPDSTLTLLAGAITGAIAGYLFGHQIDKALGKK